jgi:hypothetical protein
MGHGVSLLRRIACERILPLAAILDVVIILSDCGTHWRASSCQRDIKPVLLVSEGTELREVLSEPRVGIMVERFLRDITTERIRNTTLAVKCQDVVS